MFLLLSQQQKKSNNNNNKPKTVDGKIYAYVVMFVYSRILAGKEKREKIK